MCVCLPSGFGRKDIVEYLIKHGAKIDSHDDGKIHTFTHSLHSHFSYPHTLPGGLIPLHNACSFGHCEVVIALLAHGADPNGRDNWNFTPLHEAASKDKVDVCISKSLVFVCVGGGVSLLQPTP